MNNMFFLKNFSNIWLLAIVIALLMTSCSSSDIPFNSKPIDYRSATNLAKSIARIANCGSFEDQSFQKDTVFSCQMIVNGKDTIFNIYIFYDKADKDRMANNLRSKEELALFKMGEYYIISESVEVGTKKTTQDYAKFPGEIIEPPK
jgi:hypothetical protein